MSDWGAFGHFVNKGGPSKKEMLREEKSRINKAKFQQNRAIHSQLRVDKIMAGIDNDKPDPRRKINLRLMTDEQLIALTKDLDLADKYDWNAHARPDQQEPDDYSFWMLIGGRGAGKTRTGAEQVRDWAKQKPGCRIAVIAKGSRELRDVCFEGVSGLLSVFPKEEFDTANPNASYRKSLGDTQMVLNNGTQIIGFSAESPDSIRGHSFDAAWCDEFAAWPKHLAQDMLDQLMMTLRQSVLGARKVLTTTPKRVPHLMDLLDEAKEEGARMVITRAKTSDNTALSKDAVEELYRRYGKTHIGRQELEGELLQDVEGALWTPAMIEAVRMEEGAAPPKLRRVVVGVDPSGSATGDATGIVVNGYTEDKQIYVLGCYSTKGGPAERYAKVCHAAWKHQADLITVEYNHGGDNAIFAIEKQWVHMVEEGKVSGKCPRVVKSTLRGSKAVKASPVAALYEQQMNDMDIKRIWHVPPTSTNGMAALESELISWAVTDKASPNSLDAHTIGARRCMQDCGLEGKVGKPSGARLREDGGWLPW